uniref:Uncharacterized protein n=1 Tax=Oryza rufipogon TaxID=4529 RepID=A0A0E0RE21_ORYRU
MSSQRSKREGAPPPAAAPQAITSPSVPPLLLPFAMPGSYPPGAWFFSPTMQGHAGSSTPGLTTPQQQVEYSEIGNFKERCQLMQWILVWLE